MAFQNNELLEKLGIRICFTNNAGSEDHRNDLGLDYSKNSNVENTEAVRLLNRFSAENGVFFNNSTSRNLVGGIIFLWKNLGDNRYSDGEKFKSKKYYVYCSDLAFRRCMLFPIVTIICLVFFILSYENRWIYETDSKSASAIFDYLSDDNRSILFLILGFCFLLRSIFYVKICILKRPVIVIDELGMHICGLTGTRTVEWNNVSVVTLKNGYEFKLNDIVCNFMNYRIVSNNKIAIS